MNLNRFTRLLERCRSRWNHHTLQYVLAVARILAKARTAVRSDRRWGQWILEETHLSRPTVHRYLRVAEFMKANVSRMKQLEPLSINKLFGLSRLHPEAAAALLKETSVKDLSEVEFKKRVRRLAPRTQGRLSAPNLIKTFNSSLLRLERAMNRWRFSDPSLPAEVRSRILSRLRSILQAAVRMNGSTRTAI